MRVRGVDPHIDGEPVTEAVESPEHLPGSAAERDLAHLVGDDRTVREVREGDGREQRDVAGGSGGR